MNRSPFKLKALVLPALFVFLLAVSTTYSLAQNPGDAPQNKQAQANRGENLGRLLGLTPDQIEKIRAIRQQNAGERRDIRRRVVQAQGALDRAIYGGNADEAEVDRLARDLADAQAAEVRMRAMTELKIRRVLTTEQLNTFRQIRQERQRAQMERRLENSEQPGPLGNRRNGNAINQNPPNDVRPNANTPGNRKAPPLLGPRGRRALRRINP